MSCVLVNIYTSSRQHPVLDADSSADDNEAGVKRGLGSGLPSQQRAVLPPGARLLSSAMMQSLQPARVKNAEGGVGVGGEKRRKSADGHRPG